MSKGSVTHVPTRTHKQSYRATKRPECTALVWCVTEKDGVDPTEVRDLVKHIASPGDIRKHCSLYKRLIICVKRFWSNTLIVV